MPQILSQTGDTLHIPDSATRQKQLINQSFQKDHIKFEIKCQIPVQQVFQSCSKSIALENRQLTMIQYFSGLNNAKSRSLSWSVNTDRKLVLDSEV